VTFVELRAVLRAAAHRIRHSLRISHALDETPIE
jgi:hypothetical protein